MQPILKQEIMRRVFFIHLLKRVFNPTVRKAIALVAFAVVGSFFFSFQHVFLNTVITASGAGIYGLYNFYAVAFMKTSLIVQVLFVVMSVLSILILKDIAKSLRAFFFDQQMSSVNVKF